LLSKPTCATPRHAASMSAVMKTISFDELVQGRDSTVRVTEDRLLYAVDLVMVVTGKNREDSAKVIRDISDDKFNQVFFLLTVFL